MAELWFSASDLAAAALPGFPRDKRAWNARLADVTERRRSQRPGGGWLYPLSALPQAAQMLLRLRAEEARRAGAELPLGETPAPLRIAPPKRRGRPSGSGQIDRDAELRDLVIAAIEQGVSARRLRDWILVRLGPVRTPAERTLRLWVEQYRRQHAAALTLQTAPHAYRSRFRPAAGSASADVLAVNARWEIDTTPSDMQLEDGKRHAIIGIIDVFSRRRLYHVARTSNSRAVAAAIRKAIALWGAPLVIKMDNGKDYTSHHITTSLAALEIEQRLCTPFSPWEKPHIERALGAMQHDLIPQLPGYIGHDVRTRQEIRERERTGRGRPVITARLSADALQALLDDIATAENASPHSELGITPDARARACPAVKRIADERALDVLLAPVGGYRAVGKKGLRHEGRFYAAPELVAHKGRQVQLRVDDDDLGRIYVFDLRGAFICEAYSPLWTGISQADLAKSVIAAENAWKREQRGEARARRQRVRPEHLAREVLAHKLGEAAAVLPFPKPETAHRPAAALSVASGDRPDQERDAARIAEARERRSAAQPAASVTRIDPGRQRLAEIERSFKRAMDIVERVRAGQPVGEDALKWAGRFAASSDFTGQVRLRKHNGELPSDWQLPQSLSTTRKMA